MANICLFKGMIKGKKINCEKFLDVFPCGDIIDYICDGTKEDYTIIFCSDCKWGICAYANNKDDVKPLSEEDIEKVSNDDINKYTKYRLVDFAVLFDLDIRIFAMYEDGYETDYFHYNRLQKVNDKVPKELVITKNEFINDDSFKINIPKKKSQPSNNMRQNDKAVVLEAVKQNGDALEYASEELINDKDVVLEAVKQNGYALQYASDKLKNDKEIVMTAVKKDGNTLKFASKELQHDEEVALESLKHYWELPPIDYIAKDLLKRKILYSRLHQLMGLYYMYFIMIDL